MTKRGSRTYLVLRSIADETLSVSETDVTGRSPVAHVVCDDLDPVVLPYPHTGVLQHGHKTVRSIQFHFSHTVPCKN